jgi:hypothetical protein
MSAAKVKENSFFPSKPLTLPFFLYFLALFDKNSPINLFY